MGLDGFSMGNLGLHKDLTSAQMSNQAEQLALRGTEFQIKFVDELAKKKAIERKKENDEEEPKEHEEIKDIFEQLEEEFEENDDEDEDEDEEFVEQKNELSKGFSVKINKDTEMIELYDNKDNRIVQTITANDLIGLISKLNSASGVFVNRKI